VVIGLGLLCFRRRPPYVKYRIASLRIVRLHSVMGVYISRSPSHSKFRAFIECSGRLATHCVSAERHAVLATADTPCYTKQDSDLLLCETCLGFWQERQKSQSQTNWELARFFRDMT
jgi:hypothetical protein